MRYPLPYAFARTQQLLLEQVADQLCLWIHSATGSSAISEVMRKYRVDSIQTQDMAALIQHISVAYAEGESNAATVMSEVQSESDLGRMLQELPAVEDLLETSDDAPIIRLLNALLTQAARRCERYPH